MKSHSIKIIYKCSSLKVSYKQTGLSDIYQGARVAQQARGITKTAVACNAHLYESCCHSIINKYGYKQ